MPSQNPERRLSQQAAANALIVELEDRRKTKRGRLPQHARTHARAAACRCLQPKWRSMECTPHTRRIHAAAAHEVLCRSYLAASGSPLRSVKRPSRASLSACAASSRLSLRAQRVRRGAWTGSSACIGKRRLQGAPHCKACMRRHACALSSMSRRCAAPVCRTCSGPSSTHAPDQ